MKKIANSTRVGELNDAADHIVSHYAKHSIQDNSLQEMIAVELANEVTRMTTALYDIAALSNLKEKDDNRDYYISALNAQLKGYIYFVDAEISAAAQTVMQVFKRYGTGISRKSFAEESSAINSMLEDFLAPDVQDAIAKLIGVDDTLTKLKEAQVAFKQAKMDYESKCAQEGAQENASDIKKEMLFTINKKITTYLDAMVITQPDKYKTFADEVEEIIRNQNEKTNRRLKKDKEEMMEIHNS